jgi:ABC-type uncharacterized transport system permease subunit
MDMFVGLVLALPILVVLAVPLAWYSEPSLRRSAGLRVAFLLSVVLVVVGFGFWVWFAVSMSEFE